MVLKVICFLAALFPTAALSTSLISGAAAQTPVAKAPAALDWDKSKQGQFVMALLQDSRGDVWAATEDKGLWRYSPPVQAAVPAMSPLPAKPAAAPKPPAPWTQYSIKEGLGDDTVYALAEDRKGRIWAGTLRNGLSVWNGREWRNYGLLDGPLGERVFALATCPSDGDVWAATNAGLCRYSLKNDTWSYYTRADGLPSDQVQALAFDSLGNIYAGTQCDGLAIGKSEDNYKKWTLVPGPERMPLTCVGDGLPSNQINDILVADDETVYVATTCGLARTKDYGQTWNFIRGVDWAAKVKGLRSHPEPQQPKENLGRELLREDYVTNLSEDSRGLLLISYRVKGYEYRRPLNDRVPYVSAKSEKDQFPYVSTTLPLKDGTNVLANYGDGLTQAAPVPEFAPTAEEKQEVENRRGWKQVTPPQALAPLPSPAKAPTAEDLNALLVKVKAAGPAMQPGDGYYEGDDWRTWGDWVGRYGSRYAVLCAASAPFDFSVVNDLSYSVSGYMGPSFRGNSLRHWIHYLKTDIPRVLYVPQLGHRRQAEWDDNGESYPMSIEGPDVWVKVAVPAGSQRITLYNFNKDGHWGNNRMRDYLIELKKGEAKNAEEAEKLPTQARARMRDFWGPVYKRFVVQGPGTFWIKVGKNNSFNAILAAVFVDKLDNTPTRWEGRRDIWLGKVAYEIPAPQQGRQWRKLNKTLEARAPLSLVDSLDQQHNPESEKCSWMGRVFAYRSLGNVGWGTASPTLVQRQRGSSPEIQSVLRRWRWQTAFWALSDRDEWAQAMQSGRDSLVANNPEIPLARY